MSARMIGLGALLVTMAGCTTPAMRGFGELAAGAELIEARGIGAGETGGFRLTGGASGRFERRSRSASDGAWVGAPQHIARFGGASFDVAGPGVTGTLSGECRFDQAQYREAAQATRSLSVEITSTERPLTYRCRFLRDGRPIGALALEESFSARATTAERRAGEVLWEGERLELSSEHRLKGSPIDAPGIPIGYHFTRSGRAVGAADLNGHARLLLPRDPAIREAALAAGLALALFWDPGDS